MHIQILYIRKWMLLSILIWRLMNNRIIIISFSARRKDYLRFFSLFRILLIVFIFLFDHFEILFTSLFFIFIISQVYFNLLDIDSSLIRILLLSHIKFILETWRLKITIFQMILAMLNSWFIVIGFNLQLLFGYKFLFLLFKLLFCFLECDIFLIWCV